MIQVKFIESRENYIYNKAYTLSLFFCVVFLLIIVCPFSRAIALSVPFPLAIALSVPFSFTALLVTPFCSFKLFFCQLLQLT
jgi:hypothetical protein